MITALVGTPGSGKSYDAVQIIIDNLKKGRIVYTNIEGMEDRKCYEALKVVAGLDDYEMSERFHCLTNAQVMEFWKHIKNKSMVVIDECHKNFNARNWQSVANNECTLWASTHRHSGHDVLLITQSIEKMDKQLRDLIEWTYLYKKNNFMGKWAQNMYLRYAYMEGDTNGKPLKCEKRFYKPEVFACYKSYVSGDIKELGMMKHANILMHPIFFAIPIIFGLMIYMVFFKSSLGTGDLFGVSKAQAQQEKVIAELKAKDIKKPVPVFVDGKMLNNGAAIVPVAAPVALSPTSSVVTPRLSYIENGCWRKYMDGTKENKCQKK